MGVSGIPHVGISVGAKPRTWRHVRGGKSKSTLMMMLGEQRMMVEIDWN